MHGVAADGSGGVYATGYANKNIVGDGSSSGGANRADVFLLRLDDTGKHLWTVQDGLSELGGNVYSKSRGEYSGGNAGNGVCVDGTGHTYVAGYATDVEGADEAILLIQYAGVCCAAIAPVLLPGSATVSGLGLSFQLPCHFQFSVINTCSSHAA